MKIVLDSGQMGEVDKYTIEEIGIPSMVLMERAALSVAEEIMARAKQDMRILSVCGIGNNGGDGVAAARILTERGYTVDILLVGDAGKASTQMKEQLAIAKRCGLHFVEEEQAAQEKYGWILDALFGIGLSREVKGIYRDAIEMINRSKSNILAVDIPSGISGSDGKVQGIAVKADVTVTFGVAKMGLLLYPGREYAGETLVKEIGFPAAAFTQVKPAAYTYETEDLQRLPERKADSHKGTYGRVLVIAGQKNMSGACYLAGSAAYRSGAGLVELLTVEDNRSIMQSTLPEAVLTTYDPADIKEPETVSKITDRMKAADAVVIGPGLGQSEEAKALLSLVIRQCETPMVLDADALNLLAENLSYYLSVGHPENWILTPHILEMARLLDVDKENVLSDMIPLGREFVRRTGVVLVLKNAATLVFEGDELYINTTGNNGMSTGGSGDVLSGITGAFLAAGKSRFEAAKLAVLVHGMAGDWMEEKSNAYSLTATDIVEGLRYVLKREIP